MIRCVLIAVLLSAGPAVADVAVTDTWARASVLASRPGSLYLTLQADVADTLLFLSTPAAGAVIIHDLEVGKDGIARMRPLDRLPLAVDEKVTMAPGGMHIMLMGLTRKLVQGESFPLSLTFETAGDVTVEVQILGVASKGPVKATQ